MKANRKRRRWLIVAFVLVLVSLGMWWYWPRGDARFVGKWSVSGSGAGAGLTSIRWDLHSNGIGATTFVTATKSATYRFLWGTEDNCLVLNPRVPTAFRGALDSLQRKLLRMLGSSFIAIHEQYTVVSCSEKEIELLDIEDPTKRLILTRIPE